MVLKNYGIKPEYTARSEVDYFDDSIPDKENTVYQPEVYRFAEFLARRLECSHIIDIGCGRAQKLAELHPEFELIGIDIGSNIKHCQETYQFGTWIEHDLETHEPLPLDSEIVSKALIICADVIEHLKQPDHLLGKLHGLMEHAPIALLSTPERDRLRGPDHQGPPWNRFHYREWNLPELESFVQYAGLQIQFSGLTINNDIDERKTTSLIVLTNNHAPSVGRAPDSFRVAAVISVYNDADILPSTLDYLNDNGIEFYVLDNWSTDETYEAARQFEGRGLLGLERFPEEGPTQHYEWTEILERKEEIARSLEADWVIHYDSDEIFESPWPEIRLKDAIYYVDQCGFTCIDHSLINFHPTDNSFKPGMNTREHFRYWEPGLMPGAFRLFRTWKNWGQPVELAKTGGHDVSFPEKRVYPFKFLIRHYRIRSQEHGERKIFQERLQRFKQEERDKGWHTHYDHLNPGQNFLYDPADLKFFDDDFYPVFLVERLSSIGWELQLSLVVRYRRLATRFNHLSEQNKGLKAKYTRTHAERNLIEADRDRLRGEYRRTHSELSQLNAKHVQLISQHDRLRAENEALHAEVDRTRLENNQMMLELERIRRAGFLRYLSFFWQFRRQQKKL